MYEIKPYSYQQAQKLGVIIRPSIKKNKKIDVFSKQNEYITSIGDIRYDDYPTFIEKYGKKYALQKRRLYRIRHEKDKDSFPRGYYAYNILW